MRLFFMIFAWLIVVVMLSCDKNDDTNAVDADAAEVVDADFSDVAEEGDGDDVDAAEVVDSMPDAIVDADVASD